MHIWQSLFAIKMIATVFLLLATWAFTDEQNAQGIVLHNMSNSFQPYKKQEKNKIGCSEKLIVIAEDKQTVLKMKNSKTK